MSLPSDFVNISYLNESLQKLIDVVHTLYVVIVVNGDCELM